MGWTRLAVHCACLFGLGACTPSVAVELAPPKVTHAVLMPMSRYAWHAAWAPCGAGPATLAVVEVVDDRIRFAGAEIMTVPNDDAAEAWAPLAALLRPRVEEEAAHAAACGETLVYPQESGPQARVLLSIAPEVTLGTYANLRWGLGAAGARVDAILVDDPDASPAPDPEPGEDARRISVLEWQEGWATGEEVMVPLVEPARVTVGLDPHVACASIAADTRSTRPMSDALVVWSALRAAGVRRVSLSPSISDLPLAPVARKTAPSARAPRRISRSANVAVFPVYTSPPRVLDGAVRCGTSPFHPVPNLVCECGL